MPWLQTLLHTYNCVIDASQPSIITYAQLRIERDDTAQNKAHNDAVEVSDGQDQDIDC